MDQLGCASDNPSKNQKAVKEAEKWSFKSKIWKPKISFFVIGKL